MKNKSTQEKVVLELLTNLDTWVSGDYLAKKFQVSRETIWKAINNWQITSLIRTSPESFNGSLLMM
ncbi:HTH domain-containing protein, partial [Lactiplantibacillus plantarum]